VLNLHSIRAFSFYLSVEKKFVSTCIERPCNSSFAIKCAFWLILIAATPATQFFQRHKAKLLWDVYFYGVFPQHLSESTSFTEFEGTRCGIRFSAIARVSTLLLVFYSCESAAHCVPTIIFRGPFYTFRACLLMKKARFGCLQLYAKKCALHITVAA